MIVIFEGPDNLGKTYQANQLAANRELFPEGGEVFYNLTKDVYEDALKRGIHCNPNYVMAVDRVDWITHLTYRLALPHYEWNDERPRTVFYPEEAHLLILIPVNKAWEDELYTGYESDRVVNQYSITSEYLSNVWSSNRSETKKTKSTLYVAPEHGFEITGGYINRRSRSRMYVDSEQLDEPNVTEYVRVLKDIDEGNDPSGYFF